MADQQPARKLSSHRTSTTEGKKETTFPSVSNSLSRRASNSDKPGSRVPISLPVTSIGTNIQEDGKAKSSANNPSPLRQTTKTKSKTHSEFENSRQRNLTRRVSGPDKNRKSWAWLEEIEIDALDGLTEDVKEKLHLAAARHLAEAIDEHMTPEEIEESQLYSLKRITSEILGSEKAVSLQERSNSEPSVIVHDEGILKKVKIWHPSGPAKILKTILKGSSSSKLINVCLEPKFKSNLSFSTHYQSKQSKQGKGQPKRSLSETKPEALMPKISIVNMSFQSPKK